MTGSGGAGGPLSSRINSRGGKGMNPLGNVGGSGNTVFHGANWILEGGERKNSGVSDQRIARVRATGG